MRNVVPVCFGHPLRGTAGFGGTTQGRLRTTVANCRDSLSTLAAGSAPSSSASNPAVFSVVDTTPRHHSFVFVSNTKPCHYLFALVLDKVLCHYLFAFVLDMAQCHYLFALVLDMAQCH